jgi:hypothetical protein
VDVVSFCGSIVADFSIEPTLGAVSLPLEKFAARGPGIQEGI